MTEDLVQTGTEGAVRTITLNRPERKNALTGPLVVAMQSALDDAIADESVNSILIRGAGGALCSGLDLKEFGADPQPEWVSGFAQQWAGFHLAMYNCPKPTVCALERFAINAGSALALSTDFIVMGEGAFLHVGEVLMGRAAPMNLAWLQLKGGRRLITELAILGRRMDAGWLERNGIVHRLVPDEQVGQAAMELATELSELPGETTALMKAEIRRFEAGIVPETLFRPAPRP
jgi:enoyl-CoA hydratase/carnithine racemase